MQINLEQPMLTNSLWAVVKQKFTAVKDHFKVVPLKRELGVAELIDRLEMAVNSSKSVQVQMNFGFDRENIQDFYGPLRQTKAGQLIIADENSQQEHYLVPELIRYINQVK
ncbi:hypothetical protein PT274_05500 [Leuconostocaceae bacterium ESL0958]|nr:hypothetical protein [Leuconostocaceae bacterium ESL0958]